MTFTTGPNTWLYWTAAAGLMALAAGMVLVVLARRGRRIDDHPLCRKCGYDLTGRPEASSRCAECGADLSPQGAMRIGNRVPRRALQWLGFSVVAMSLLIGAGMVWLLQKQIDLMPYKPVWVLRQEAASSAAPTRTAAINELMRRLTAGKLSDPQIQSIIADALRVQGDLQSTAWQQWEYLVRAIDFAGKIGDPDWIAFIRQGLKIRFETRPQIRPGDPVPLALRLDQSRLPYQGRGIRVTPLRGLPMGEFQWVEARLEDRSVGQLPSQTGTLPQKTSLSSNEDFREFQQQARAYKVRFDRPQTAGLAEGTHPVLTRLKVHVRDARRNAVIGSFELSQTTMVSFVPADTPDERLFVQDPTRQQEMERAITKVQISVTRPGQIFFDISHNKMPMALTHRIYLRSAIGNEALMFPWMVNTGGTGGTGMTINADPSGLERVDVVIRPDLEGLLESTLPERVWGGEIVIRNVPVRR